MRSIALALYSISSLGVFSHVIFMREKTIFLFLLMLLFNFVFVACLKQFDTSMKQD
jgi:hypothetical protein